MSLRAPWNVLARLFTRDQANAVAPPQDGVDVSIPFAEIIAASAYLDFGPIPLEWQSRGKATRSPEDSRPDKNL